MTAYTIGYRRDDGDFRVVTTLNNNDEIFCPVFFKETAERLKKDLSEARGEELQIIERQDAPDYVDLGEEK